MCSRQTIRDYATWLDQESSIRKTVTAATLLVLAFLSGCEKKAVAPAGDPLTAASDQRLTENDQSSEPRVLQEQNSESEARVNDLAQSSKSNPESDVQEAVQDIRRDEEGADDQDRLWELEAQARSAANVTSEIELRQKVVARCNDVFGEDDFRTIDQCNALQVAQAKAKMSEADRQLLREVDQDRLKGNQLYRKGLYREAMRLAEKEKDIYARLYGEDHPKYADSLYSLALQCGALGDYERATALYNKAKTIQAQRLGNSHPDFARTLLSLGQVCRLRGDYQAAESLYVEAEQVQSRAAKLVDPSRKKFQYVLREYYTTLNNLGVLYDVIGKYEQSKRYYILAKDSIGSVFGQDSADYARSVHNLGMLYIFSGDYGRAEPLLEEAVERRRELLGPYHNELAVSVAGLGLLAMSMGDYERAEPLLVEARQIDEKVIGRTNPQFVVRLQNLATLFHFNGDYSKAIQTLQEAKTLTEEAIEAGRLDPQHPLYAICLNNLAAACMAMKDFDQAETHLVKANAIWQAKLGKGHPEIASGLGNLGEVYAETGRFVESEEILKQALAIQTKTIGEDHPDCALVVTKLAQLSAKRKDYVRAEELFLRAIDATNRHIERTSIVLSEQRQMLMADSVGYRMEDLLDCVIEGELPANNLAARRLQWKGAALLRARAARLAAENPEVRESLDQLRAVSAQYAELLEYQPVETAEQSRRLESLAKLERQREALEKQIAKASREFRAARQPPTGSDVQESIPSNAVLIDFIERDGEQGSDLAALVHASDGQVELVYLGLSEPISQAIEAWRTSVLNDSDFSTAGMKLRRLIWQRIEDVVGDADLILVSPEGPLCRLPFAALPAKDPGRYLIEDYTFVRVPVPRLLPELLSDRADKRSTEHDLLVVGGVNYNATNKSVTTRNTVADGLLAARGGPGHYEALPDAELEAESVADMHRNELGDVRIKLLTGDDATENAFARLAPTARRLHIATHGFFAGPEKRSVMQATRRTFGMKSVLGDDQPIMGYPPGLLSGLVFAGANEAQTDANGDGILTAQEVSYLPMGNVDLAVLSACETVLGESAGGEGLLGLQRAFQVAGVRSTVASLWKVNDRMTRLLMETFYENELKDDVGHAEALRNAQHWLLNHPAIVMPANEDAAGTDTDRGDVRPLGQANTRADSSPSKQVRTSPKYWAAFTLSGDWR